MWWRQGCRLSQTHDMAIIWEWDLLSVKNECMQIGGASEPAVQAGWEQHESECWTRWLQHSAKRRATRSS
jgi:hypothetical protein